MSESTQNLPPDPDVLASFATKLTSFHDALDPAGKALLRHVLLAGVDPIDRVAYGRNGVLDDEQERFLAGLEEA